MHIAKRKASSRVERVILGTPAVQKLLAIKNFVRITNNSTIIILAQLTIIVI